MIRTIASFVAVGCIFFSIQSAAAEPQKKKHALAAAKQWLLMVDQEQYLKSWQASAGIFRNAVKPDQWMHAMQSVRKPLGQTHSRTLKMSVYKTSLPGAPDGEYVVIQFETSFTNKKNAVETITPMLDGDGVWRVSGYYIK